MLLDEDTEIQNWLGYLSNLPQDKKSFYDDFQPSNLIFTPKFIDTIKREMISCRKVIEDRWPVKVISGKNFDPSFDAKFKDPVPKTDLYFVFLFYRGSQESIGEKTININTRECLRLFQCKYELNCNKIRLSPSKIYDHIRSHTSERPFPCIYQNCGFSFT